MTALALNNIAYRVGDIHLLSDITLNIQPGTLNVLLGPNGAGKSTLLKIACGELEPATGSVQLHGIALHQYDLEAKARSLGVLPQSSTLNFSFSVFEVVMMGRIPHSSGQKIDEAIVEQALAATDVSYLKQQCYTQLSGGEQQRVQLARVLAQVWQTEAQQSPLLILDEPTSALDFSHQKLVLQLLRQKANEGTAVLMALHDINLASAFADNAIVMRCGSIVEQGSVDKVLRTSLLEEVFGVTFFCLNHPQSNKPHFAY